MNEFNIKRINNKIKNDFIKKRQIEYINNGNKSFEEILQRVKSNENKVKFSKHAIERMNSRKINLTNEEIKKLESAVKKAEEKGVKEALILMNDTAFVTSIKNRTVITTATSEQLKENVFTNIDGAVVI
ncbi:TIGR02530 family flagellar biosynthesis protein [Caldisalinibacter kiritimatiensis]|uniref:Putative flagellar hook associated protein n=1 Tax=Caldisalinibacter kiritimatiensis TaxID=1304284 RepID=R1CBL3_9FIRM|nr:TIGR02530 family flagellar biosynthesis protein [Caldisalinibacter kiritimatiensis]EOC99709.1 Putative flagellar hook associated protein [Caldisalinibacter kiritimatiensis]